MAENTNPFPHLTFEVLHEGRAKLGGGGKTSGQTKDNLKNRPKHADKLGNEIKRVGQRWVTRNQERAEAHLPDLPPGLPLTLKVDESADIDFLRSAFGFEIVAEEDDGVILVATDDLDFQNLHKEIGKFLNGERGEGNAAKLHNFLDSEKTDERLKRVLDENLLNIWASILDDQPFIVDVSIACTGTVKLPKFDPDMEDERLEAYRERFQEAWLEWEEIQMRREQEIRTYLEGTESKILKQSQDDDGFFTLPDSFTVRIQTFGKMVRDLAQNHPHLIILELPDDVSQPASDEEPYGTEEPPILLPPYPDAPAVCVVDSGIQEEHLYLKAAVFAEESRCFLPGIDPADTSDYVHPHGHGTRVAGVVLYPDEVPKGKEVVAPCWLLNARVLNHENKLSEHLMPALGMEQVVGHYTSEDREKPARIFNHSINSRVAFRGVHMSTWAAAIDKLTFEKDVLVIQSAGNIFSGAITAYWRKGHKYPKYQDLPQCGIRNPGQSLCALTVGSISYAEWELESRRSIAKEGRPSAFSAVGPGIWGSIKPDMVEIGGDFAIDEADEPRVVPCPPLAKEMVRSTMHSPGASSKDEVGTSYSAPRVSHIVAWIAREFPNEPCLLYRALIANSARWPEWTTGKENPLKILKHMGYGVPDLERATTNTDYRVTLITSGVKEIAARDAHVYHIEVPEALRRPGDDYLIRIDVTLSYAAMPRRTRRKPRGYLSTTVDWDVSKEGESLESFRNRIFHDGDKSLENGGDIFNWVLRDNMKWGEIKGASRQNSTLQKDWCYIRSNALPPDFCIAVVGHEGWNPSPEAKAKYALAVSFDAVNEDLRVYERIKSSVEAQVEVPAIREQIVLETDILQDNPN